jgi:Carboxypeptidase regulatory-like domain
MHALRIASPCSAHWADMPGNDKIRHCSQCQLDVYNFSAMTELEINQIVAARTGRLCARFFQRSDGTMLTENCPTGIRTGVLRGSTIAAVALAALVTIAPTNTGAVPTQAGSSSGQMLSAHQGLVLQVRDPSGAVLPGAAVSIVNAKTGQHWDLTTDSNGGLALLDLPEGSYELTVTASGFSSFVEKNLTVPGRVAITLQIGALMGEVVIVTGVGTEPTSSETPAALVEPLSANPDVPLKPSDHRNALQKFFAKLHRAF